MPHSLSLATVGPEWMIARMLHVIGVGLAIGAVAVITRIHGQVAWPLGAFAATTLYLLGAAVELAVRADSQWS
jgi:hypothetical protein